ncbi:AntA/AntB antirepressor [Salmonella enterica subsp. enterica]|nr:AntA/AntB antirepressor [Salmonella enterica subsp. enterica serovar Abaetetuba]
MTNQLIPVFNGTINNEYVLLCDARELHTFLGVGKRFASWITDRIEQYGFIENQDYIAISQNREIGHGRGKIDYHLTLDTAKETAMVERNEKGRQIRRYFIECEKKLRQQRQYTPPAPVSPRYQITLHYRDTFTGFEEIFRGVCDTPEQIIHGTAKKFGYWITGLESMPASCW